MGQWNTLHIIDERKLTEEIIPIIKTDEKFVSKYVEVCKNRIFQEPTQLKTSNLAKEVIQIANQLSEDFRTHTELVGDLNSDEVRKKYYSLEIENFRTIFHRIVFSECALAFPYFKLGYRLITNYLNYSVENSISEQIVDAIKYYNKQGSIFPGEFGVRNWINSTQVKTLNENTDQILPNLRSNEYRNHNKHAEIYVKELKEFTKVAANNNFGLISCLDSELKELQTTKPIGKDISWKMYNLKQNLIFK